jgi:hypothetical protein
MKFFKPEDFNSSISLGGIICQLLKNERKAVYNEDAARIANEKLASVLGPRLDGYEDCGFVWCYGKKLPCKHEPETYINRGVWIPIAKCKHCKKKLKFVVELAEEK